jgi:hypothetical protein
MSRGRNGNATVKAIVRKEQGLLENAIATCGAARPELGHGRGGSAGRCGPF